MKSFYVVLMIALLFMIYKTSLARERGREISQTNSQNAVTGQNTLVKTGDRGTLVSPIIRVEPDSLSFLLPRFVWASKDFYVYNDGDQPLTISITDIETTTPQPVGRLLKTFPVEVILQRLKKQLDKISHIQL